MKSKAFTLIELLVVVAIIGILAAVGVTTFNGFQLSAKKTATIQQWKTVSKFIQYQLKMCDIDGGTLQLSPTRSINCNAVNNKAGVNLIADTFMNYFIDQNLENPYDKSQPAIVRTGGGGGVNGRIRLDETDCPGNPSKKRLSVWVAVHDNSFGQRGDGRDVVIFSMDSWCS